MSDFVIEADGLTKRYNGAAAVDHKSLVEALFLREQGPGKS
jgi:hypothetical protein